LFQPSDKVRDMMNREVSTLERNEELALADRIMSLSRIRHMPVVDEEGRLVGILSQRDLFRSALIRALGYGAMHEDRMIATLKVKEVMSTEVETAHPDDTLGSVARRMAVAKIGCLPVVEGGQLVGILTESDFVLAFAEEDGSPA
jgi:CBS domain-containing protein